MKIINWKSLKKKDKRQKNLFLYKKKTEVQNIQNKNERIEGLYQVIDIKKTPLSAKPKNSTIKRLDLELINISTKLKEEIERRKMKNKYKESKIIKSKPLLKKRKTKKMTTMKKKIMIFRAIKSEEKGLVQPTVNPSLEIFVDTQLTNNTERIVNSLIKLNNYDSNIIVREYIENSIPCELDLEVLRFINKLNYRNLLNKKLEPLKFKKRIVFGMNQVKKSLSVLNSEK